MFFQRHIAASLALMGLVGSGFASANATRGAALLNPLPLPEVMIEDPLGARFVDALQEEEKAPPTTHEGDQIRVVVISDMNQSYGSTHYREDVRNAIDEAIRLKADLVLSTGDMVAGQRSGLNYRAMWRAFHRVVTTPLEEAGIPLAVTPGNHDASGYSTHRQERRIYRSEWLRHRPDITFVDDANYPLNYSFTVGPAFFISLDDTVVGQLSAEQMEWLEGQLMLAESFPVRVVFGHIPLYPFAEGRAHHAINDPALEAMLNRHDVDLFISGHHHAYYPGVRGDLRLVSMSCLGAGPRPLLGNENPSARSFVVMDIDREDGIEMLEAVMAPVFDKTIRRDTLPTLVGEGETAIMRDDVRGVESDAEALGFQWHRDHAH